jgi:CRISPR-associated protein Cas5t
MNTATVFLRLDAPVAAWRWLQAGVFRGTFPVIPPSAAWGLALNLAGVETRGSVNEVVTPIRPDAPALEIAVGFDPQRPGNKSSLYQQLHSYPVGNASAHLKEKTYGAKYHIAPVRREVLVDQVAFVGVRGEATLLERLRRGLAGELATDRYGIPFAGDNQFLFSRIDVLAQSPIGRWFVPTHAPVRGALSTRLTTLIDRGDSSRTEAPLFAAAVEPTTCPNEAWTQIGPRARESIHDGT